jgi:hypothetical protein
VTARADGDSGISVCLLQNEKEWKHVDVKAKILKEKL